MNRRKLLKAGLALPVALMAPVAALKGERWRNALRDYIRGFATYRTPSGQRNMILQVDSEKHISLHIAEELVKRAIRNDAGAFREITSRLRKTTDG